MEPTTRREALQRLAQIRGFRAELAELEREEVLALTREQHASVETHLGSLVTRFGARFGSDLVESRGRLSLGMRLAALLGGAAFFAALVLFFHRIWGTLPQPVLAAALLVFPLVMLAGAEIASRRGVHPYYTSLLAIAAGVGFVIELSTLGSALNVVPSPHALLVWGCFAVLVAYAYGLRIPLYAGVLLLVTYPATLLIFASGGHWENFLERPEALLPAAVVAYAVPPRMHRRDMYGFRFVYRICGAGVSLVAVFAMAFGGGISYLDLSPRLLESFYQLTGLALSVGLILHGIRLSRRGLVNAGAAAFIVFLFVNLHAWWWDWMPKYLFFLLLGLIAAGLLLVFRRLRPASLEGVAR